MRVLPALSLIAALACAGGASAAVVDPVGILRNLNAVILTNGSTQADVEGRAVIGGNYSGASMYNAEIPTTAYDNYGALTVYGSTSGNPINIDNGGNAYVAGTHGAIINFNGGGHYTTAPTDSFADVTSSLLNFSTKLSQLSSTSTLPTTDNNEVITATANAKGVAVFNITAAQLDAIPSYKINLNGAKSVVFNVSGSTINFNGNYESGASPFSAITGSVIWNFFQATTVNLGTQILGSVLAVQASVTNNNQIDGALVAKSWHGQGELHNNLYTGVDPTAVPEPGTWALMLVGVAGVGCGLRRARARRAVAA